MTWSCTYCAPLIRLRISSAFFGIFGMFLLRNENDSLGIKREMYMLVIVYFIVLLIRFPFKATDLEANGQYASNANDALASFGFCYYIFFHQVFKSKRLDKIEREQDHATLQKILNDDEATKAFALYLASHLSIENLLFYRVVDSWTKEYFNRDQDVSLAQAQIIYNHFIDKEAPFMINISFRLRDELTQAINNDSVNEHSFNKAKVAVFISMDGELHQFH